MEKEAEQQDLTADTQDAEVKKSASGSKIAWGAFLLLVCANAGGGYWLWSQQQAINKQLEQGIEQASTLPLAAPPVDLSRVNKAIADVEAGLQQQVEGLSAKQVALAESFSELNKTDPTKKDEAEYLWAMAEVDYLLNIANQRVLLSIDPVGAIAALNLADSRIESVKDYRLHPLRELIAEEVLALSSVNQVDIQGIALKLSSAMEKVNTLQVLNAAPNEFHAETEEAKAEEGWKGALNDAWHEVKSLVVIRHQQDGGAAVLVPEQRYFLYQNLRLQLETAQRALLSGQASVYKESLNVASSWLNTYFIGKERDALLAMVTELGSTSIDSTLPDISGSLTWLRGFNK